MGYYRFLFIPYLVTIAGIPGLVLPLETGLPFALPVQWTVELIFLRRGFL